ncbi:MAG: universal stress protein [Gammaproteobacteria bacterium]|nr:universal stress protein [Gammaproteobacteria bacterium]
METSDNRPILVPVDFSEESKAALLYACDLSVSEQQRLVVLHVVHDDGNGKMYRREADIAPMLPIHEIAEQAMQDFIDDMNGKNTELDALKSAKTIIVDGLPVTRILEVAEQVNAGHIVVDGNDRSALSRMLNGSVSRLLVEDSPVPVTVFRSKDIA